jgi:YesN/AraC family two-component response regulator
MEAKDGPDALELARENKAIHALITDVVMPGLNGRELAEKISTISPGIRIVYLSGYSNTVIAEHGILPQGIVLVEKPFELRKLAESLEQMLSQN